MRLKHNFYRSLSSSFLDTRRKQQHDPNSNGGHGCQRSAYASVRSASYGMNLTHRTNDQALIIKHDGLAEDGIPFVSGARGEGTNGYALWRNNGGQHLPTAAGTPTGLPSHMAIFRKK